MCTLSLSVSLSSSLPISFCVSLSANEPSYGSGGAAIVVHDRDFTVSVNHLRWVAELIRQQRTTRSKYEAHRCTSAVDGIDTAQTQHHICKTTTEMTSCSAAMAATAATAATVVGADTQRLWNRERASDTFCARMRSRQRSSTAPRPSHRSRSCYTGRHVMEDQHLSYRQTHAQQPRRRANACCLWSHVIRGR